MRTKRETARLVWYSCVVRGGAGGHDRKLENGLTRAARAVAVGIWSLLCTIDDGLSFEWSVSGCEDSYLPSTRVRMIPWRYTFVLGDGPGEILRCFFDFWFKAWMIEGSILAYSWRLKCSDCYHYQHYSSAHSRQHSSLGPSVRGMPPIAVAAIGAVARPDLVHNFLVLHTFISTSW